MSKETIIKTSLKHIDIKVKLRQAVKRLSDITDVCRGDSNDSVFYIKLPFITLLNCLLGTSVT